MANTITEAGKRHSAGDMNKIQGIHDHSTTLGAVCDVGNTTSGTSVSTELAPSFLASDRGTPVREAAALRMADSHDAVRGAVQDALRLDHYTGKPEQWHVNPPYIRDMFPDQVVYDHAGKTMKRGYSVERNAGEDKPTVKLHPKKVQVHIAYVPVGGSASNPQDPDNDNDNDVANPEGPGGKESMIFLPESASLQALQEDIEDLKRFRKLKEGLRAAPRMGKDTDEPEGSRYIQMSETLLNQIVSPVLPKAVASETIPPVLPGSTNADLLEAEVDIIETVDQPFVEAAAV